jgi:hypothetical protein
MLMFSVFDIFVKDFCTNAIPDKVVSKIKLSIFE